MSEKDVKNRVVVVDDTGEVTRLKSDAEIVKENEELENALKGPKEEPQLDPEILKKLSKKSKNKEAKMEAVTKRDRSLYFGCIGIGQAGSRLCETFYKLGYEGCVFNTAQQDLEHIEIPNNKKILLPFALGGAGGDISNGQTAMEQNADLVIEKIEEIFSDDQEMLLIMASGGGGSGSGGLETMINLASSLGKPIGVIYVLPLEAEGAQTKHNAIVTLGKIAKLANTDVISSLIVVDNAKIELMHPNLSKAEFWDTANDSIVTPLHMFNTLSSMSTKYDSLDPMDQARLWTANDCQIYGTMKVYDYEETTALSEAVIDNLESGLLASDFDLSETRIAGIIITGNNNVLSNLPSVNISYAHHMISEKCDSPQLVSGVYEVDDDEDCVTVYTILSGLGLPQKRIQTLKDQAAEQKAIMDKKEKTRASKMTVDYGMGNETQNKTEEIHRQIKQKKSGFAKITNNAGNRVKDRRKR